MSARWKFRRHGIPAWNDAGTAYLRPPIASAHKCAVLLTSNLSASGQHHRRDELAHPRRTNGMLSLFIPALGTPSELVGEVVPP